ncbi:MAG TPA: hypothetical protein VHE61_09690 [Opitutaceae bacterium]|nr:hypothetical protein [Opitutaceae bacterium]
MKLLNSLFRPKASPMAEYERVASVIEAFVAGTGDAWDWDDLTARRQHDPFLESIRLRCVKVPDTYPPAKAGTAYCNDEGMRVLSGLASEVRAKLSAP